MKVIFKQIEIHNFMSYADETFDFENQRGMNLICGINKDIPGSKNACGKSSLCHALIYAIYGQLPFKLKNDNIINRYIDTKEMSVSIVLSIDNKKYKIISGLKNRQSFCSIYDINGQTEKNISKSTIQETRDYIIYKLLKCDLPLFMRTIMLNSDPSYNFYNLSKADKTEFVNKLFNLAVYGNMYANSHSNKISLDKELATKNSNLMIYLKNKEDYERGKKDFDNKNLKEINELTILLEKYQSELKQLESESIESNEDKINKCIKYKNSINEDITKNNIDISSGRSTIRMLKSNISDLESQIHKFSEIVRKHGTVCDKLCKDCKVIFSKHYKIDQYKSEIEALYKKVSDNKNKINSIFSDISRKESNIKIQNSNIAKINSKMDELSHDFKIYTDKQRKLTNLISNTTSKIKDIQLSTNPYESLMDENNTNIEKTKEELEKLTTSYKNVISFENIVKPDNIKKILVKDMIIELNNSIKTYLHKMGANYDVQFDVDMNYEFITKSNKNPEYHNFSSGEQMRISIATCFAFMDFLSRRNNINSNILMLDEFIDSNIDTMAIDNILEILSEFTKIKKQNVFIISHRNEVRDSGKFNNIIQIEKCDNISNITYA